MNLVGWFALHEGTYSNFPKPGLTLRVESDGCSCSTFFFFFHEKSDAF